MAKITKEAALLYHSQGKPGKIEVVPTCILSRCGRALPRNREKPARRL